MTWVAGQITAPVAVSGSKRWALALGSTRRVTPWGRWRWEGWGAGPRRKARRRWARFMVQAGGDKRQRRRQQRCSDRVCVGW